MTPETRARRVAELMWTNDAASRALGLEMGSVAPGRAELSLRVEDRHLNGHKICHGGVIFTLADTAFAFACNTQGRVTVAQENQITYMSPGKPGERLTARAAETASAGRSGVFDVTVTGEDGRVVALMRGLSRQLRQMHLPEDETAP